jgi:hypothetical protein
MNRILLMVAALLVCQTGHAGDWYVGGGLGMARAKDASENAAANSSTLAQYGISDITSHDDSSGTLSIFGGYQINKYLAAELAYTYLGTYDMHGFTAPAPTLPAGREQNRADAFSLAAVFSAPLGKTFSLYGKLGPTLTTNEQRTCISNVWWCDSSSDVRSGLLFGVGGTIHFPRLIGHLRLEADRFNNVGDSQNEFTAGRFNVLQLQYVYTFSR